MTLADRIAPFQSTSRTAPWMALQGIAVALAALVQRHVVMANPDVAWLLTVCEKLMDGARLYVDVLETNPPAAVWAYMPFAALGRVTGLRAEVWLDILLVAAAAASVLAARRLLPDDLPFVRRRGPLVALVAFAVLTLLPASCFGEREHMATIALLPVLALCIRRSGGGMVSARSAVAVGLCATGLALLKPHLALGVIAASAVAAVLARNWRVLLAVENLTAAGLCGAYLASTSWLYPMFWTDMAPLVNLLYLPARLPLSGLLYGGFPLLVGELVCIAVYLIGARKDAARQGWCMISAAAIAGLLAAAIVQGKGWPYHFYPAFSLIVLLVVCLAVSEIRGSAVTPFAIAGVLCVQFWLWFDSGLDLRSMHAKLRAVAPHPRMASLASDFAVGFPAVRALDGVWIGRTFSRWIPYHVDGLSRAPGFDPALLPAFRAAEAADRAGFAADLAAGRPDVLLVERRPFDFLDWGQRDPAIAAQLTCYAPAGHEPIGDLDTPGAHGLDIEIRVRRADCETK